VEGIRGRQLPVQLTRSDDAQGDENWSPEWKVDRVCSGSRRGRDLRSLCRPASGGEVINLTATAEVSETDAMWSRDGTFLAYSRGAKEASTTNIAVLTGQLARPFADEREDARLPLERCCIGHRMAFAIRESRRPRVHRIQHLANRSCQRRAVELTPHRVSRADLCNARFQQRKVACGDSAAPTRWEHSSGVVRCSSDASIAGSQITPWEATSTFSRRIPLRSRI